MRCVEPNCDSEAKGCDIEAAWDEDGEPIWAIHYECILGHMFIAEFERDVVQDDDDTPLIREKA